MMEVGRLCVKIAGRDAKKKCVIVEKIDDFFVIIDGETRRRKCNIKHIEPLDQILDIKSGDHATVVAEFKKLGIEIKETKPKQKKDKPKQIRAADRKKMVPADDKKAVKKKAPAKKADAPAEKAESDKSSAEAKVEEKTEAPASE